MVIEKLLLIQQLETEQFNLFTKHYNGIATDTDLLRIDQITDELGLLFKEVDNER
jgi:hypothetical protein